MQSDCKKNIINLQTDKKEQVRRTIYITILSLASLLMLVVGFVPHHHHGDVECVAVERCMADDAVNDEHTSHHANGRVGDCCLISHVIPQIAALRSQVVVKSNKLIDSLFSTAYIEEQAREREEYRSLYVTYYTCPDGRRADSLRSPPQEDVLAE